MTKIHFLLTLRDKLAVLPEKDIEERLSFYSEMIEDRMEDGLSEDEAVSAVGSIDDIAAQIIKETSLTKIAKEKIKQKTKTNPWVPLLIVLGAPLWLSLGIAVFAIILSIFISLWAIIISFWSIFISFAACSFAGLASGIYFICINAPFSGWAMIGAGVLLAGLSIFLFYGCNILTRCTAHITKNIPFYIKKAL